MKIRKSTNVSNSIEGYASCACAAAAICSCSVNNCSCACYGVTNLQANDRTADRVKNQSSLKTNLITGLSTNGKAV